MRLIYVFALMLLPLQAFSQEEAFYINFKDKPLTEALVEIEEVYSILFSYKDECVRNKTITLARKKRTLSELLIVLQKTTSLNYELVSKRFVTVRLAEEELVNTEALDLIIIKSYLAKGIEKNKNGSYTLYLDKLNILPGLIESDVLESIQLLPSVLSPNETATNFFVRGGFADQNRLIWDGINLYHKGHLFGMISPLNPNITQQIDFINKGAHPRYGERLSSITDIVSKSKIVNKTNAAIGLNGVSADAIIELPIIKNQLSIQASLRRSHTDIITTPTFNQLANKVFESTKINQDENGDNAFYFLDYNVKLNYKPNASNSIYASLITIDNQLDYIYGQQDVNRTFNDILNIKNSGYSLGWHKKWSANLEHKVQAFFSDYRLDYNFITTEAEQQISNFEKRNSIFDSGVSLEFNYKPSSSLNYSFGYQYTLKDVAYAFINTNIDLVFVLDTEETIIQSHSAFLNLDYKIPKLFDISFGLRGSYFQELTALRLEPRLQILKPINSNLSLQTTAEIKNQIINEIDETVFSDLSLENSVWRLSNNDDFPIKNSKHISLGFIYNSDSYSIDFDTYYKDLKNITALSLGFLNPENTGFNIGEQSIFGLDMFVKKRFYAFNTWLSYSFNNAKSTFENINNNQSFKAKSQITHAISTALSYKLDDFQFALGWRWQTGRPYTIGTSAENGLEFNSGVNTGELPIYHRLDFSSTYSFNLAKQNKLKAKLGLSIRNLYNRKNLISREYRGNNSLNDPVEQIDRFSIGITPNLLFRLYL